MKIASYIHNGAESYGAVVDDGIIDLRSRIGETYPDLLSLIQAQALDEAAAAVAGESADVGVDAITFLPLIPACSAQASIIWITCSKPETSRRKSRSCS
ncbi:MAG: hypothetical protein ACKVH1_12655 [Alphaproteobacteria bacterium]